MCRCRVLFISEKIVENPFFLRQKRAFEGFSIRQCKKLNYEQTDELQNMGTAITTSFLVMAMSSFL